MIVGVVGSRGYPSPTKVADFVRSLPAGTVVVSGGARGVDTWAVLAAQARGLACRETKPDLAKHPVFALAAKARNREIVEESDEVVAFWDGESPGTPNTVAWAVALGKPVRVVLP